MAKAELRKADAPQSDIRNADPDVWRERIGGAVRVVRGALSLKEFAALIQRDERQVSRWEDGKERPQFDAIFAVEQFQAPLVLALAELTTHIEAVTTLTIRRSA